MKQPYLTLVERICLSFLPPMPEKQVEGAGTETAGAYLSEVKWPT